MLGPRIYATLLYISNHGNFIRKNVYAAEELSNAITSLMLAKRDFEVQFEE